MCKDPYQDYKLYHKDPYKEYKDPYRFFFLGTIFPCLSHELLQFRCHATEASSWFSGLATWALQSAWPKVKAREPKAAVWRSKRAEKE